MRFVKFFLLLLVQLIAIDGYKILSVFPSRCKSHWIIGHAVMKTLAEAGHEVYVISPFPLKTPLANYHDVSVDNFSADDDVDMFETEDWSAVQMINFLSTIGEVLSNSTLSHPNVQKLLKYEKHFDAVVVEVFWVEALYGLGAHYDCPVIALSTFSTSKWTNDLTKAPMDYSYVAHNFIKFTSDNMNFYERTLNTLTSQYENIFMEIVHYGRQRSIFNEYFADSGRTLDDQMKNVSLVLINHHFSTSSIRPFVANMIEIGGIHVEPAKPLPDEVQSFLDSATDGAILFSMGSIIQGKDWEVKKREAFVNAFGKLKQKVLWKYENETLPKNPGNVMISSWIPQRDILAHPNIKLFITHGGLLGTTEAMVEGVPVLGIPIYGDQKMNMLKAQDSGQGILMELEEIDDECVEKNLRKLLTNEQYARNAKAISKIYNDRPMTAHESTVYWVEYVIRNRGAPYLQSPAHKLSYVQLNLIDVYSFIFIAAIVVVLVIGQALRFTLRTLRNFLHCSRKSKSE